MHTLDRFLYNYTNLSLYQFHADWIVVGISIVWALIAIGVLFFALRLIALSAEVRDEERAFYKKKQLLDDLVLMKDIQTELEKEIEQAILKAAFQS